MKQIKDFIKKLKDREVFFLYAISGVVALCALGLLGFLVFKKNAHDVVVYEDKTVEEKKEDMSPCANRRYYDGVCDKTDYEKRLVAVMVENHTDARPQSGLADAVIVYEAPVEANFTRFMAFYPLNTNVEKIGPVRSARPYYLDWLEEYGRPMYMHVGGSPEALQKIELRGIFDVNEFSRGWYFWRDNARYAPHNAYTSSKLFQAAWEKYGKDTDATTSSWHYGEEKPCHESCVGQIRVTFSLPSYIIRWNYNTSTNQFDRYQTEGRHKDTSGKEISADTVIIQKVISRTIDAVGRKDIETVGTGEAIVFANGIATTGTWKKDSLTSKTQWLTLEGNAIPLKPGKIWVEVVGNDSEFDYK